MKIDLKAIKELAKNIEKYNLTEINLEVNGTKIILKKEEEKIIENKKLPIINTIYEEEIEEIENVEKNDEMEYIVSPMVGTFYTSSAPGNPAFVRIGSEVSMGETLCIIEAMKLMNEVKAEGNCKIAKILVEDGQIVKKGDKLFGIVR